MKAVAAAVLIAAAGACWAGPLEPPEQPTLEPHRQAAVYVVVVVPCERVAVWGLALDYGSWNLWTTLGPTFIRLDAEPGPHAFLWLELDRWSGVPIRSGAALVTAGYHAPGQTSVGCS